VLSQNLKHNETKDIPQVYNMGGPLQFESYRDYMLYMSLKTIGKWENTEGESNTIFGSISLGSFWTSYEMLCQFHLSASI